MNGFVQLLNPSIPEEMILSSHSSVEKVLCPPPSSPSLQSWPEIHLPFGWKGTWCPERQDPVVFGNSRIWPGQNCSWAHEKQHLGQVSCQGIQKGSGTFLPPSLEAAVLGALRTGLPMCQGLLRPAGIYQAKQTLVSCSSMDRAPKPLGEMPCWAAALQDSSSLGRCFLSSAVCAG